MHVPLGLAITETIAETQIPCIAHHHDFYWERLRYSVNAVNDYLCMAFPPNLPNISHVVINSEAREQLALRTGISSCVIPNVFDFDNPPSFDLDKAHEFKAALGVKPDDRIILQPTRVVQRKGIEHAIELVKQLDDPKIKLVVSHEAGDEGYEYANWLKTFAKEHCVDLHMVMVNITDPWNEKRKPDNTYSLKDVYAFADFITYPSLCEGFGNAFLEAIYFKKPLLINRYATFVRDIEPHGFDLTVMDGYLSVETVQSVKEVMNSPKRKQVMVDKNYQIASRHFSYHTLRNRLNFVMNDLNGNFAEVPGSKTVSDDEKYMHHEKNQMEPNHFEKLSN